MHTEPISGAGFLLLAPIALLLAATPAAEANAARIRRPSIEAMCAEADAVIEGQHLGEGEFRVLRVYQHTGGPAIGKTISVPFFAEHPPELERFRFAMSDPEPLDVDRALLFLKSDNTSNWSWTPLGAMPGGALGVIWIGDKKYYWYVQISNPGGLGLVVRKNDGFWTQGAILGDNPHDEVEAGVLCHQKWRSALASNNPIERAEELARYLIKRTSPANDTAYYARLAERRLGSETLHGPLAIIDAIRHAEADDRLDNCVHALSGSYRLMRVQGYHRLLEYSINATIPLLGDEKRIDQRRLIESFSSSARPEPLEPLRRIANSSEKNAQVAAGVIARIEADRQEAKTYAPKPTEDWAIELWEVYVKRNREERRSGR